MKKATNTTAIKSVKAAANNGKKIKPAKKLTVTEAVKGIKSKDAKKKVRVEELTKVKVKKVTAANKPKKPTAKKEEVAKVKKVAAKKEVTSDFNLKAFKKAIKASFKKQDKDIDLAQEVIAIYKGNRKQLKDALPKHAVNAFEKSLGAKKDEDLMLKAVIAANKHIVEKDFTL